MPILKPVAKSTKRKPTSAQIKGRIADLLDEYSRFLDGTPKSSIVEQALEHVFDKDKEFQVFLNKDGSKGKQVLNNTDRKAKSTAIA